MRGGRDAEVVAQLTVDVDEAPRHGPHVGLDREGQADGVAGRGVRILPDDEHAHVGERLLERAQHAVARGEVGAAGGDLGAQPLPHPRDVVGDGSEDLGPAGVHEAALDEGGQGQRHGRRIMTRRRS